jgi:WhiB family redox-sensing transcriptional regulator
MNIDELAQAARAALDEEYAGYSPAPGLSRLEDDAIGAAVTRKQAEDIPHTDRSEAGTRTDEADEHSSNWVTNWSAQAACRTTDPDEMFVQGAAQNRAKAVCTGCPVRTECLADALDNRVEFGVWGGMTERERRALLRRRPTVTSWRQLLESARRQHQRGAAVVPLDEDLTTILEQTA